MKKTATAQFQVPASATTAPTFQMENTFVPPGTPVIHGYVGLKAIDGKYVIRLYSGGSVHAARSAGCVISPDPGDTVLVYVVDDKKGFILQVLEKCNGRPSMDFKGDVRVDASEGVFQVDAHKISLSGGQGVFDFLAASFFAMTLDVKAKKILAVGNSIKLKAKSMTQTLRDSLRRVKNMDTIEAKRKRTRVAEKYSLKSKKTKVRADDYVSIDGGRVRLG